MPIEGAWYGKRNLIASSKKISCVWGHLSPYWTQGELFMLIGMDGYLTVKRCVDGDVQFGRISCRVGADFDPRPTSFRHLWIRLESAVPLFSSSVARLGFR